MKKSKILKIFSYLVMLIAFMCTCFFYIQNNIQAQEKNNEDMVVSEPVESAEESKRKITPSLGCNTQILWPYTHYENATFTLSSDETFVTFVGFVCDENGNGLSVTERYCVTTSSSCTPTVTSPIVSVGKIELPSTGTTFYIKVYAYDSSSSTATKVTDVSKTITRTLSETDPNVAHIGSTYYTSLTDGIKALDSTSKILILDKNVDECVYIDDTAIIGKINLNGKTWSCTNSPDVTANAALAIYASGSGTSNLTITDTSSDSSVGTITSSSNDTIRFRGGTLNILKGIISNTGATGNPLPVWIYDESSILNIGGATSNTTNLQILNLTNGISQYAISTNAATVNIYNGLIVANEAIYGDNSSSVMTIGASYSTKDTLQIISNSTSGGYGVYSLGTIKFVNGFVGSGRGSSYAFNKTPTLDIGKIMKIASVAYNGTTYYGKIVSIAAAHIGSTVYTTLASGIKALDSTSKTLVLDSNSTECISISTTVKGTIDLNGKTWNCSGSAFELTGDSSNITITDNSGSIGSMTATVQVVTIKNNSTLYVHKGIYKSTSSNNQNETFEINSGCTAYIGTSSNTTSNLQVIGTAGAAVYSYKATIYINGGLIKSTGNSAVNFYNGNLYVFRGTIQATSSSSSYYAIDAHPAIITIGNSSSNPDNLKVLSNGGYAVNLSSASTMTLNSGVVLSTGNHGIYVNGGSSLSIGNTTYTSSENLYLLTGSSSSKSFYVTGGTSSANSTANIGVGFLGVKNASSYYTVYGKNNENYDKITWTNGYGYASYSATYDNSTYKGTAYGVVYIVGSPNVYYGSLKAAVNKTNSSTVTTIKTETSINECITISSTKKIIFDILDSWGCSGGNALKISGSSNYSEITIQNSGRYGENIHSNLDTISLSFAGTLTILGGRLEIYTTNTGNNYAAIWNTGMATINIGNSSDDLDLKIYNNSGYAIYSNSGRAININNGLIVGKTYGVYSTGSSNTVTIGASYSTKKTLQIISLNTDSASYGVYTSILNYVNGFMGSGYGVSNAFKYTSSMTGTADGYASVTYNGVTYNGIYGQAIASIGDVKYGTLQDAINALDSTTSKTIKLLDDINECVTVSDAKRGSIDLNSKTWSCKGNVLNISNSSAYITITDSNKSNVGKITTGSYPSGTIRVTAGTLYLSYGIIESNSTYSTVYTIYVGGGTLRINGGDTTNLQILSNAGPAIYVANNSSVTIWSNALIKSTASQAIYASGSSTTVEIRDGTIVSEGATDTISVNSGASLDIGYLGLNSPIYIINMNSSTSYYAVKNNSSTVKFNGGFIGSAAGASYAYYSITIPTGVAYTTSYTYNGTTYSGKSIGVAHIGSTYYSTLTDAFAALDNTTIKTIVLDSDIETSITINTAVKGIIDLNGKTWSNDNTVIAIFGASDITITNSISTIGKISTMASYAGAGFDTIYIRDGAILKIYKAILETNANLFFHLNGSTTYTGLINVNNATLIIGNASSTTSNLKLTSLGRAAVINVQSNANITINNGTLSNTYSSTEGCVIYTEYGSSGNTITINKGNLSSTNGYGINLRANANLIIGNENSTISNLKIISYYAALYITGANSNIHINTGLIISSNSTAIQGGTGTLTIGDGYGISEYSTVDNLQIITTSTSSSCYGISASDVDLNGGFVGATSRSRAVSRNIGGNMFDATVTYNGTTYYGQGAPIVAYIGDVYYGTLKAAINALDSSTTKTIKLVRSIEECISISTTKKGIIDLNGKNWTCTGGNALSIGGSSTGTEITITDTSNSVGTITASSDTISASFNGKLTILRGIIKTTNGATNYAAIWNSSQNLSIIIGDSGSTTSNLQILAGAGYAIYSSSTSSISINNGLIVGKTTGIYSGSSASIVNVGTTYSNSNTLHVLTTSTSTSYYGVSTVSGATFKFNAGFIGHAGSSMSGYAYATTPVSPYRIGSTVTYNGTTIYGYKAGYASLNSVYYGSLQYAANALPTSSSSTSATISLLANINESVTLSTSKYGTINLNGKTWTGTGNALSISNSSNTSDITITDITSSVGTVTAPSDTFSLSFAGTLTLLKGIFKTTSTGTNFAVIWNASGTPKIIIGDENSNTTNLQILAGAGYAIYSTVASEITVNNGLIVGKTYGIYSSNNSARVKIGAKYTRSSNLQIFSLSTSTSEYGIYTKSSVTFTCGFVGSAASKNFNASPNYPANGGMYSSTITYNGTTITGLITGYAKIYSVYYGGLQAAVDSITGTGTTPYIYLTANVNESVSISTSKNITIYLEGKTWNGGTGNALSITGGADNTSTITITDSSSDSSVGSISSSMVPIQGTYAGTLNVLRGKISATAYPAIAITGSYNQTLNIGNSTSNETNLQITTSASTYSAIQLPQTSDIATITINGGLIKGAYKAIHSIGKVTLNLYRGTVFASNHNAIHLGSIGGSSTLTIGDMTTTSNTLKIISGGSSSYAIAINGTSSEYATLKINGGFMGGNSGLAYTTSYTNVTINGELGDYPLYYDGTTYAGKVVYAASVTSGSTTTYFESIPNAFSTLNTSTKTIKLLKNYNGNITLNNVKAIIDLNGKGIYYSGSASTLTITGSTSNVTIKDTSSGVGNITYGSHSGSNYAIDLSGGTLYIYKGIIIGGDYAINASGGSITIGDSDSTTQNLQVSADVFAIKTSNSTSLNINKGNIGAVSGAVSLNGGTTYIGYHPTSNVSNLKINSIEVSNGTVNIMRGGIVGDDYAIWASSNSKINIGESSSIGSSSTIDNLKIIAKNSNAYAIKAYSSAINIYGGFMGASSGSSFAYTKDSNSKLTVYGELVDVTTTYDGITYSGKTVAVASIGDTYYYSLQDAFDALPSTEPSTYPTIKILGNRIEQVELSTTRYGIVDLNGKTWSTRNFNLYGTGGSNNKSNITITDNSGSIGSIISSIPGIYISDTQMNLKLIKGNYAGYYGVFFKGDTLTIGDSSSTLENLIINGTNYYGVYIYENSTAIINNAKITTSIAESTAGAIYSKGEVIMNGGTVTAKGNGVFLAAGAEFTMNGGTINSTENSYHGLYASGSSSSPINITINGGTIFGHQAIKTVYAAINIYGGTVTGGPNGGINISSGSLTIGNSSSSPTISSYGATIMSSVPVYIYNGKITGSISLSSDLTIYGGTIIGTINSMSSNVTITVGVVNDDYYSSADRLKIFNTSSGSYAITMNSGTFKFNRGFIGAASGNSYAYSLASGVSTIIGDVFNSSDVYNSTTYQGKAISVAHIGSTKYKTLKEAFDALDSTTTKRIVLDGNVDECIHISSTKKLILDLNGNKWDYTISSMPPFFIVGSDNNSDITITDNSSNASGQIGSSRLYTAISLGGDPGCDGCNNGIVKIIKGTIYGIQFNDWNLVIGDSASTSNNLRILGRGSLNPAIYVNYPNDKTFTYNGGFIGSDTNNNYNYTYGKNASGTTYTINGLETNTAITYNGITYYGIKLYVAHNQTYGTYYETLKDAFNGLSSTSTTKLWLDANRSECVSVSTKILAEIDLRGYTWEADSSCSITLSIGGSDYSTVTITDTSSNVGKIIAGNTHAISATSTLLNIYKGIITYKNSLSSPTIWITGKARINVGNSESTEENLQIYGDYYGIYIDDLSTTLSGTYVNAINAGLISANTYAVYFTSFNSVGAIMKLNVYGGTIKGSTGIYASVQYSARTRVSLTIGNSKSTINNLKIVSTSATGYGISTSGSSTSPSSLIINGGFIGSIDSTYGHTYSADSNTTVIINGAKINKTVSIDETTYYGFTVAIAHIGDTYYNSLEDAFDALDSTTNKTIVLDGNPNECVSFSTTKKGTIDLNGKTWSCTGNVLLEITGGSSNMSMITITDNSGSIGTMDASVENIRAYFDGSLSIDKGNLKAQYYVISTSNNNAKISLGSGATSASDLVISNTDSVPAINLSNALLFMYNGTIKNPSPYSSAAGISAYNSSVNVYKGVITSDSYAIKASNNSYIYVGNEHTTIDNLKVISTSTSNNTINLENSSFIYSGGFISNKVAAYNKNTTGVTYKINGHEMDVNTTYEETTYTGITLAAASIGDTYYVYVQDAVDALTSSSNDTTIKLEKSLAENVIINSKVGIIDLNDKTWYATTSDIQDALNIEQNSNITITSSVSSTNEYGGTISAYNIAIQVDSTSTLKVLKGSISGPTGIFSNGNVIIGDINNSNNIEIGGIQAISTNGGTLVVNDGTISGSLSSIDTTNTKININRGIIYSYNNAIDIKQGSSLTVGTLDSTLSNLMIIGRDDYGVKLSGTSSFTFIGGFIGSARGYDYAYQENASNVTYKIQGKAINVTATYDGVSYPGKTPVVAHIGSTYYNYLYKAFNDLNENTTVDTTIVLDADNIEECVVINATKVGTIDLNGKTWTCSNANAVLEISGGTSNKSKITITDNSGSIGTMDAAVETIRTDFEGTLQVRRGNLKAYYTSISKYNNNTNTIISLGDAADSASDLVISSTSSLPAINLNNAKLFMYNGTINSPSPYSSSEGIRANNSSSIYVYKGTITSGGYGINALNNSNIFIGNESSNTNNLKIETTTSNGAVLKLGSGSSTTITNGSIVGNSGIEIDGGSLEINGGTITGSGSTGISATNQANVTINGGNITSSTTYAIEINQSAYTMSGGTVIGTNGIQLVNTNNNYSIDITGGTIKGTGTNGVGIYANGNNYVEISNATIVGTSYGINSVNNNGKIIVNSGNVTGNIGIQAEETYMVHINGGIVTGTGSYAVNMVSGETFYYEGGTLIGSRNNKYSYYYGESVIPDIPYEEYTIINNDNMYETKLVTEKVASIVGGGEYYKLSEAIDAAKDGDTIKILKDITPSYTYDNKIYYGTTITKKLTIDLNGKTINYYIKSVNNNAGGSFIEIVNDVKIVGTGNIISYNTERARMITVMSSNTFTLGDANEAYSEDLVITSNYGYVISTASNNSTFVYNSGKLVVNSSNSKYSNIYDIYGRFVTRSGYHVEMTHVNNVHTAILVNESIINDNNQLEIIYKEMNDKLHIIVKSNKKDRTGVETISLDISKKVDSSYQYVNNTCEITNKECETVIDSSDLAYLYNVTYANELVIRYVNKNSEGMVLAEESIAKDLTITPTGGTSKSIYRGENDIISDGDILLLNVRDASTINDNMKANKEAVYAAIFGKHWNNILKTISDPQDVSNCLASSGSVCTNLTSMGFTATYNNSAPIPAGGVIFNKILVYNYAPKLNENTTVQNVTCEYGSECAVSELSFLDYKGNKIENVENIITLNGEVVNKVDSKKLGNYVVTTYAIDNYGNRSKNIVRTYSVVDTEAPVIEVSEKTIYVEKGHGLKDLDIKAIDNYDEDVTVEIITSGVNFNKKGTYEIIYKATDSSGNTTLIYRTVVVRNTREITLYIVIAILSLIILALSFVIIKNKKRINV